MDSSELSSVIFPNGLLSAGDVHDELYETKAIKRVGYVDLGTLNWLYNSYGTGTQLYTATLPGCIYLSSNSDTQIRCLVTKYLRITKGLNATMVNTMSIISAQRVSSIVYTHEYNTATKLKAALDGVYLYYELTTPIEYELDTPLDMSYRVDDFGTESVMSANVSRIFYELETRQLCGNSCLNSSTVDGSFPAPNI